MSKRSLSILGSERLWKNACLSRLASSLRHEDGASIVEMAISAAVLFSLLLGVIQVSLLLFTYHFVSDAAREATRYAMVRGSNCKTNVYLAYCSPTDSNSAGADNGDIQAYVNGLGYPYAQGLTTSTTWYTVGGTPTAFTSCGTTPSGCNTAGSSMVQVTASYNFPLGIPFWRNATIAVSSTSAQLVQQ